MHDDDAILDVDVIEEIPPKRINFPAIEFAGKKYDRLVLRSPTAQALDEAEAKSVQSTSIAGAVHLIHRVSGLPLGVCLQLDPRVLHLAGAYFERFTPPAPKAGGDA
ncbi:Phage tail assembly chaperone protein, E, or 41 or 14 [Roseomonas rosea]|uniref:Phage tail assembly chaperone protein, E, or 41 or 14 n=1 Tax=Muricoccus roseus TaxID=198092 RepID=A0A1M6LDM2_9PROT|nr:phage tail assembly protein [Roseomonas rosea]SHJ69175.1 Phage tail assembly chaperone protein, E, or 41 or 14 [Roseomonas rosea]